VEDTRERIRGFMQQNLIPPSRSILNALIIGEKGSIPPQIKKQFASLGIAHVLAISGLHVGILAYSSYLFFMSLFRLYHKSLLFVNASKVSVFLSIIPVLFYCFIAGFHLPTLRATLMVLSYLIALLLRRRQDLIHTVTLAAFIILVLMPSSLFDLSFQLSFTAVLSIIILVPKWRPALRPAAKDPFSAKSPFFEKLYDFLFDSLLASGAALLGTAPLVALHFHYFPALGLLFNIIIIPIIGFLIVPLGLFSTILLFLSPTLAKFFFQGAGVLTDGMLNIIPDFAVEERKEVATEEKSK
jgi:competence protein ComEC